MKKAFNIFQNIEILIAIVVLLLLIATKIVGYEPFVVETGSMEPNLPTKAVAYVQSEDAENIKTNDIIAFHIDEKIVTHRVIKINDSEEYFVTKGDANNSIDPVPVKYENCIGVIKFHIPYLGSFIKFVQTLKGKIILGGIIVINIILSVIISFTYKKQTNKNIENQKWKENDYYEKD